MIEVLGITKEYGSHKAVDEVSFSVAQGEIVGFLGPNGAGKSTTMKILSGFLAATSGTAKIAGHDVAKEPLAAKSKIGYLPETPPVYLNMDVESYLLFAARLHGVSAKHAKAAVEEAMLKCGLIEVRRRLIGNLSKGYRQRVGLAQAVAHKPPVLILDEPTVGLDPRQIIEVRNLIQSLGKDHTVILSTHILPEVQATCQRVIVIDRGRIIARDSLEGLASRMQSSSLLHVHVKNNPQLLLPEVQNIPGVLGVSLHSQSGQFALKIDCQKDVDVRPQVAAFCVRENLDLLYLSQDKLSLEDAFVKLITKDESNTDTRDLEVS